MTYNLSKALRQAALLCAAVVAVSCSRSMMEAEAPIPSPSPAEEEGQAAEAEVLTKGTVRFSAGLMETKAQLGPQEDGAYPTLWTDNDAELKLSLNFGTASPATITPSENYRSATFDAEFDFTSVAGPYTFYAVSPSSAAQALSPSREAWKVSIPCEQTPTEGSVDEAGIILAATSVPYTAVASTDVVDLQFDHLTAYGRISFSNLNLAGDTVKAVELTATTPFVGDWYWKCEDGHELIDYGASSTLTINTSRTTDIWFACAPVDMSEQMMLVSVITSHGVFEKLIEFPANRKFEAGQSAVFTVDMSGADYTAAGTGGGSGAFELVTDASTLAVGDEILIVYSSASKALGASAGSYRTAVEVSISGNAIATVGDATVLTLAAGSSSGTWAFKDGSSYLASQSSGNSITTASSVNANSSWTISIVGGDATINAQAGGSTLLQYNTGSPRFTCYKSTSNMKNASIYRLTSVGADSADPMLENTEYGCYLGAGLTWIFVPGTDQVTRSYSTDELTYTLIDPAEVEELEISGYRRGLVKGDDVTVSVSWRKGLATVHTGEYPMTVIKEQGPKVWLGDGSGNGFIIKK